MTERTATITGREDTEALRNLFEFVNGIRGVDFALYRQATVTRKLGLRLEETRTYNCREYLSYLKAHPEELDNLIRALTIKVSNFFRNPLVFELLEAFILPELIAQFRSLSVWSLGCANGEEPYSIAMLAHELLKREKERFDVNILGMDICEGAVDNAVRGEYPAGELLEVKKKYMDAFFDRVLRPGGHPHEHESLYRITDTIKEMVKFECGDIAGRLKSGKVKSGSFNLILCRNVLIYMNRALQTEIAGNIRDILKTDGYLIIGESETVPEIFRKDFVQTFPGVKIYRKRRA